MTGDNKEWKVLRAVRDSAVPVGAVHLSGLLDLPPANIGRILLKLESLGMVEKVQNKGRAITERGRRQLEEEELKSIKIRIANELIDSAFAEDHGDLLEILQVRKLLEGYTARLCAELATEEQIRKLEDLQFDYVYELRHGRAGEKQDLELHLRMAEYAGNSTIERILKLILVDNDSYAEFTKAAVNLHGLRQDEHGLILEAVRRHDGAQAQQEMENHLNRVIRNVESGLI